MRAFARLFVVAPLTLGCSGSVSDLPDPGTGAGGASTTRPAADSTGDRSVPTAAGSTSTTTAAASETSVASSPGDSTDADSDDTGVDLGPPGDWLLTVDRGRSPPRLVRVSLAGAATEICALAASVDYTSLAFARDGTLYGLNAAANRVDVINPCNCSFQLVGPTSLGPLALALAREPGDELRALDVGLDALVRVDRRTGLATVIGPLGFAFGSGALAWSEAQQALYAVEGDGDALYTIDPDTGAAVAGPMLSQDVVTPGLAVHPNDGQLYGCDGSALFSVDRESGQMTSLGALGLTGACQTLAAPQTAVACLDDR